MKILIFLTCLLFFYILPLIFNNDVLAATDSPLTSCTDGYGIDTAIGCIPFENTRSLAQFILSWGIGIAGGVALILIVIAGFQIITSSGNPQKLSAGKELLTAAVMGIVLLLFGIYLLRLIGADILNIPEFGN